MNLIVTCPNGISNFWDGIDFVFEHKNKLYALNKSDDWFPLITNQLLKQNNCTTMQEFNAKFNKHFNK